MSGFQDGGGERARHTAAVNARAVGHLQQAAIAAALSAGVNPMVAAGNPLAIAALQAQQNHPLMAQQASAQLAAAQQSGLVMTPHGLMVLPRGH